MSIERRLEKLEEKHGTKVTLVFQFNYKESVEEARVKATEAYVLDGGVASNIALSIGCCNYAKRAIPGQYTIFDHVSK